MSIPVLRRFCSSNGFACENHASQLVIVICTATPTHRDVDSSLFGKWQSEFFLWFLVSPNECTLTKIVYGFTNRNDNITTVQNKEITRMDFMQFFREAE